MEQGLGVLLSAGWTLDECLDLSWEQLGICIRCVVRVKTEQMRVVMEAVGTALGGKKSKRKRKAAARSDQGDRDKEKALLASMAAAGVPIHDQKTPSP